VLIDGSTGNTAAWPASFEQQQQYYLTYGLKPYLDEFEKVIPDSLTVGADKRDITAEHNVEGLLRADSAGRAAFYGAALGSGGTQPWMTTNEVRRKENLPPWPGGDELQSPMATAPAGDQNVNEN